MTINHKIKAANIAMDAARALKEDAHDMAVEIAHALAEERTARLVIEKELNAERKRRKAAEAKLQHVIQKANEKIRQLRASIDEARNFMKALYTRSAPSKTKPAWLEDKAWQVFLTVLRFGNPNPSSGGVERGRESPLPRVPRQNER